MRRYISKDPIDEDLWQPVHIVLWLWAWLSGQGAVDYRFMEYQGLEPVLILPEIDVWAVADEPERVDFQAVAYRTDIRQLDQFYRRIRIHELRLGIGHRTKVVAWKPVVVRELDSYMPVSDAAWAEIRKTSGVCTRRW